MDQIFEFIKLQTLLDVPAIAALSALLILFLVQVYFYFSYYKTPISYFKQSKVAIPNNINNELSVSIVIVAKNDSENLEELLPLLLKQDYANFEIIVVNDGSTDETQNYVEYLAQTDARIYYTFSPMYEDLNADRRKVLALTIGIKAAKNDVLLFTEPSCRPADNSWIRSMLKGFGDDKDVVLGYSKLIPPASWWERVCRFDNLLYSLQYFSMAIKNKPFAGTYRNVAYRKHLFFDNKGFSSTLNFNNAEEVFLNRIMNDSNTAIVEFEESFIETKIQDYWHWKHLKSIYCGAKRHFKGYTAKRFSIETCSRYLFFILSLFIVCYSIFFKLWMFLLGGLLIYFTRFFIQLIILKSAAKHFQTKPFYLSLVILDIVQPMFNYVFYNYSKRR